MECVGSLMVHLWISMEARRSVKWERWCGRVGAVGDRRWDVPLEEFRGGGGYAVD